MSERTKIREATQAALEYAAELLADRRHEQSAPDALMEMRHEVADWVMRAMEEAAQELRGEGGTLESRAYEVAHWIATEARVAESLGRSVAPIESEGARRIVALASARPTPAAYAAADRILDALSILTARGEAGGDSTDCPTCGDELAVYWEEGRIRGVVSLDQPARAALLSTPRGEGEAAAMSANLARALAAMQAAWIEWRRGRGADAAMQWIENTLIGPGLIPGDDESDAQAFFDRAIAEIEEHRRGVEAEIAVLATPEPRGEGEPVAYMVTASRYSGGGVEWVGDWLFRGPAECEEHVRWLHRPQSRWQDVRVTPLYAALRSEAQGEDELAALVVHMWQLKEQRGPMYTESGDFYADFRRAYELAAARTNGGSDG